MDQLRQKLDSFSQKAVDIINIGSEFYHKMDQEVRPLATSLLTMLPKPPSEEDGEEKPPVEEEKEKLPLEESLKKFLTEASEACNKTLLAIDQAKEKVQTVLDRNELPSLDGQFALPAAAASLQDEDEEEDEDDEDLDEQEEEEDEYS